MRASPAFSVFIIRRIFMNNAQSGNICPSENINALTEAAYKMLISELTRHGNAPSDRQKDALKHLVETYSKMAFGLEKGRIAFPMQPGVGKTTSIACWMRAAHEGGLDDLAVAVAASQVEQLCELKRYMLTLGIPAEKIGLMHSYSCDPAEREAYLDGTGTLATGRASEPTTPNNEDPIPNDERQFLLVTHNRVKSRNGVDAYMAFRGGRRSLLVWDESLIAADCKIVSHRQLEKELGWVKPDLKDLDGTEKLSSKLHSAVTYVEEALSKFQAELERQFRNGREKVVQLPKLDDTEILEYKAALRKLHFENTSEIRSLLSISQYNLIISKRAYQGGGTIHYAISVPRELESIVILDASAPIRELMKLDESITSVSCGEIINYDNVQVHQMKLTSGRRATTKHFSKRKNSPMVKEFIDIVKSRPEDEAFLVFTFKPRFRQPDFREILEQALRAEGIDTEAKVTFDDGKTKPKFSWLTHGNECAYNGYGHCANVLFFGMLWRSELDIIASIKGQANRPLKRVSHQEMNTVMTSEVAYRVHQGICRGACRKIQGEHTLPMNVWLPFHDDSLKNAIMEVMPGVDWSMHDGKYIKSRAKADAVAEQILKYLEGKFMDRISSRAIKQAIDLKDVTHTTFARAMAIIDDDPNTPWRKEARSLVRLEAELPFPKAA
jgi:hypothetical protein